MRPRGMTLAEVQKGYRDDSDGDDGLSQRQQQQQAPQLSQERQLLQAAAMIHTALMLVSGVACCRYWSGGGLAPSPVAVNG
jgi:hypothetical protein